MRKSLRINRFNLGFLGQLREPTQEPRLERFLRVMDNSWVKLYRKITDNEVLFDDKALRVFIYLLANVNKKTGKYIVARFRTSQILKLNPNTFKDVLKRLEKKYEIITIKSTNKYTEVSLLNWSKYNPYGKITPSSTPTKHQQNTNKTPLNKTIRHKDNKILHEDKLREPLQEKKLSEKQELYRRVCEFVEDALQTKFTNYPKQMKALKQIFASGYTEKQIYYVVNQMLQEDFFSDKGFDLMTVMNQMPLYKAKARKVLANVSAEIN